MAFLTPDQLHAVGFRRVGKGVLVSDKASIYGAKKIEIGDNSRIDDFCVISAGVGGIKIGRNVHIACYCSLIGASEIMMEDFSGLSSRVSVYSSSDDYSGEHLTNPTVAAAFTGVKNGPVRLGRHVIVGAGSIILPDVDIGEGAAVGALSLVTTSLDPFGIYVGSPAKKVKERSRTLLQVEQDLLRSEVNEA